MRHTSTPRTMSKLGQHWIETIFKMRAHISWMVLIWIKKGAHAPIWSIKMIGVNIFEPLELGLNI